MRGSGICTYGSASGLERDHEAQIFRQGTHFFHIENWYSMHGLIRCCLRLTGLHGRGRRNALDIRVRRHDVILPNLPPAFDGFTILHLSDLHVDSSIAFADALVEQVRPLDYDLCVLTGDYRTSTFGPFATLDGPQRLRAHSRILRTPCSAITTPSAWRPAWRRWTTGCC